MKKSLLIVASLLLTLPGFIFAQGNGTALPSAPPDDEAKALYEEVGKKYFDNRDACLNDYQFGSVVVTFTEDQSNSPTVTAGQTVKMTGMVENTNAFPLPQGRLLARIVRQDEAVAADNWHPIVAEFDVAEDMSLPAYGSAPFTIEWPVPTGAPTGLYRAEVNYLAAGHFSMAGLSFVPNFTATSRIFQVQGVAGSESYLNFDRSSVKLNGTPYTLRSVPPTFNPGQPLTIEANLAAVNANTIPATITVAFHEWSDTDNEEPIRQATVERTINPHQPTAIPIVWNEPLSGAYEIVVTAKATNAATLPSILKVRVPIAGNTPRIIFSGLTKVEGKNAIVTTCAVNGTFGDGEGKIATQVLTNGNSIGQTEGAYNAQTLTTTKTAIALNQLNNGATVRVQATNDRGEVTDSHEIMYSPSDIASLVNAAHGKGALTRLYSQIGLLLVALFLGGTGIMIFLDLAKSRRPKPPVLPDPPSPITPREINL